MWIKPPRPLNELPTEPGIYQMLDEKRKVLYVGKARNLRKRVSSYFQRKPDALRTQAMVVLVRDIEFNTTASEADALVLEHNLIKQIKPRYNVLLKDSKTYPYILLRDEIFPRLQMYRGDRSIAGEYFGPFPHAGAVHTTIHLMQKAFQLRDCEDSTFLNRSRPCMQYQIGRCSAPCVDMVSQDEYTKQASDARSFLKGQDQVLLQDWQQQMLEAAAKKHFEQAAMLRDRIAALRTIFANAEQSDLPEHADVLAIIRQSQGVMAAVGVRRGGRDLGVHTIKVNQALEADDIEILQSLIIERYRQELPPKHILLACDETQRTPLQHIFKLLYPKLKIQLYFPKRGTRFEWLKQVVNSATETLAARSGHNQEAAFKALQTMLGLEKTPELIAAVDNAHLGGKQMLSAIVYADSNGARKDLYRKYKLDDASKSNPVLHGDDYAGMTQVLTRFFTAIQSKDMPKPDILLIDGGKGQLKAAFEAYQNFNLDIKLLAVAKGDKRKTGEETLWAGWADAPSQLKQGLKPGQHDASLLLIARIRDEAHRFASKYLQKRRKKAVFSSSLDGIEGIGTKKRTALLQHFGGISGVKKASREQLKEVSGMSDILADRVFQTLHK
ncbi:excinuclease ABC subunit UvrC [Ghiorsea bivora]|uniref:excinuclease ABC subunit UvrC n=1 Tax=Ghiorsea bivora TaxID=1485545 RepID=UPI00056F690F|nr:excinuclease ABC subunit UvrC [Ghiorsea bivora]